jgi:ABC-type transporter Mla MlaB component
VASLNCQTLKEGKLRLIISGRLDADSTSRLWPEAVKKISDGTPNTLEIDATETNYCDGAGIGLLLELKRKQQENNGSIQIEGLKTDFQQLMTLFDPGSNVDPTHIIEGNVIALYGDFRVKSAPKAVMEIRTFLLETKTETESGIVFGKTYKSSVGLESKGPEDLVSAFDRCLVEILTNLEQDLAERLL